MKSEPRYVIWWKGQRYGTGHGANPKEAIANWLAKYPEEYRPHFRPEDVKAMRCER